MKKILFIFISIVGVFSFVNLSQAANLPNQLNSTFLKSKSSDAGTGVDTYGYCLGSGWIGSSTHMFMSVKAGPDYNPNSNYQPGTGTSCASPGGGRPTQWISVRLRETNNGGDSCNGGFSGYDQTVTIQEDLSDNLTHVLDFDTPLVFRDSTKDYQIFAETCGSSLSNGQVDSKWFGQIASSSLGDVDFFRSFQETSTTPPSLYLSYPDQIDQRWDGRLDFTNWVVFASFSENGNIGVLYDDVTSSIPNMRFIDKNPEYAVFSDNLFAIPKHNDLRAPILSLDAAAGKTWYAYPFYENASGTKFFGEKTTFKIKRLSSFCLIFCTPAAPSSSVLAGPFSGDNGYISPSSTLTYTDENGNTVTTTSRYACNGLLDISGCLANAGNDIIDAFTSIPGRFSTGFTEGFKLMASTTKATFPLSVIIAFNNDINSAQATSSDIKIVLGGNGTFGNHNYTFYSSSTTAWIQEQTGFDYKSFFDKLFYFAISMLVIFATVAIIRNHMNNRGPTQ